MARNVPIGTRAELQHTVEHKHTLAAHNPDLPPVLSTPQMIGWMELACWEAQQPYCDLGETTVGTAIHVDHRAPSFVGQTVRVEAVLERVEGRFHIFRVTAWNNGQQIGSGTVHRAVINVERFMKKIQKA